MPLRHTENKLKEAIIICLILLFEADFLLEILSQNPKYRTIHVLYQGFRFFSRLAGRSDPWSKNGGSFSVILGPIISNQTQLTFDLGSILYLHTDTDTCMHICILTADYTVKPVLSSHSKKKTNYRLMQVKSIAILSTFINLPFVIKIFVLSFLSGCLRHVLMY